MLSKPLLQAPSRSVRKIASNNESIKRNVELTKKKGTAIQKKLTIRKATDPSKDFLLLKNEY